jgi:tetratricopeptide (TPR) repeat protein
VNSGRRIFGAVILIDLIAFACFFGYEVAVYSADRIVPAFALRWEFALAMRSFLRALPGLQFLGLAVALGSSKGKAEELVQGAILPTVILSSILAAGALIGGPQVEAARSGILSASSTFTASLASVRAGLASRDLKRAREELGVCQAIARKDPRLAELEKSLSIAEINAVKAANPPSVPKAPQPKDPVAAKDLYLQALAFAEKGDFLSANFYASKAAQFDPSYTDARRLAATSWEELQKRGADPADKAKAEFYSKKLEGYGLLRSGDPVGAYRVFKELADAKHADDPDVRRYLAESLAATEKAAFFKDEADGALSASLVPDIFFRVPGPAGARGPAPLRMIAAKDAALAGGALYFREFEYLEASPSSAGGGPKALVRSPFAKLTDGKILLVCVERNRPASVFRPAWSAGPSSGPASLIELPLSPEAAYRALSARVDPPSLSVLEAWKAVADARGFGIDSRPIVDDLLQRSALPFALFTAAALGALAGGRFRRRGGSFPRGLYALVPVMALALVPVFLLSGRVDALISAWSAKLVPGLPSLFLAAGIRTLVLFLAVLLMAGARDVDGEGAD